MIENLFNALIEVCFSVIHTLMGYTLDPLIRWFQLYVPTLNPFLTLTTNFITRVLNGVAFAKEVILNVTGLDRGLFTTLVGIFFAKILFNSIYRLALFIFNLHFLIRGSHAIQKDVGNL